MDTDYLVIGAGSAGCVVASRLTEDPGTRVMLLEAGPRDTYPWIHIPAGMLRLIYNSRVNWMYQTEPEPGTEEATPTSDSSAETSTETATSSG